MLPKAKPSKKASPKASTKPSRKASKTKPIKCRKHTDDKGVVHHLLPDTDIEVPESLIPLLVPIEAVLKDPANPRETKNLPALVDSIKRFGVRWPVLANKRTQMLEAGHQRLDALIGLGLQHIPVIWVEDDNLTAAAFNIADNRVGEIVAGWDPEALEKIFSVLKDEDALEGVGFDEDGIADLKLAFAEDALKGMGGFDRNKAEGKGKEHQEKHGKGKDETVGNQYWFYAEFYEDPETFEQLKTLLGDKMKTGHEIHSKVFADMVRTYAAALIAREGEPEEGEEE